MARSNKCSVCKNEYVDEIDKIFIEKEKVIKHVTIAIAERFANTEAEDLTYSSIRRHFVNKHHTQIEPNIVKPIDPDSLWEGEDLTAEEESALLADIEIKNLTHLSSNELIENARRNKKVNLEYAAELEALLEPIRLVHTTAENDRIRLDALKQEKETLLSINKLKTDYIQIDIKARDAADKSKDDTGSGLDENFVKTLISFSRMLKDDEMFKIAEEEQET